MCPHCGKEFNRTCLYEHMKWHCPRNPAIKKRSFKKKKCAVCKRNFHEKSFSRHVKTHSKQKK